MAIDFKTLQRRAQERDAARAAAHIVSTPAAEQTAPRGLPTGADPGPLGLFRAALGALGQGRTLTPIPPVRTETAAPQSPGRTGAPAEAPGPAQAKLDGLLEAYYEIQRKNVQHHRTRGMVGAPARETERQTDALRGAISGAQREVEQLGYGRKYRGKVFEDNFSGQFGANMTMGRLSQDESMAWNTYLNQPTPENKAFAENIGALISGLSQRNAETLADDGSLPWLSKSLARYLPQLWDQTKAQAMGGLAGGLAGSAVAPGPGTAWGVKAGIVAGSGAYSFQVMPT